MKQNLRILLLGSGGREAAMAWKILQSPRTEKLFVAPGNAGTADHNVSLDPMDFDAVEQFVEQNSVDMVVVGPEQPLVAGIADRFAGSGVKVIGPEAKGAMLEGSKEFAKEFMFSHGIPTARFMTVTTDTVDEGYNFLESLKPPYVLKADGLAAGKGVIILQSLADAKDTLADMLEGMFGQASSTVVIEEFLSGIECSVFVATDGEEYRILPVAKDYKRIGEGDTGPNTGGMGAVSPVPFADGEFMDRVERSIVQPTLEGLRADGIPYSGFLFIGLMNVDGYPMVIEYNVRMGDPETEVVMPRIKSDLVDIFEGIADKTLALKKLETDPRACVTVMTVSGGYPDAYEKGKEISGIEKAEGEECILFHAGTRADQLGRVLTSGGRVLACSAFGADISEAAGKALRGAEAIEFEGKYFRRDISADLK
jgi:phosphoribosylamine--glycine ligase